MVPCTGAADSQLNRNWSSVHHFSQNMCELPRCCFGGLIARLRLRASAPSQTGIASSTSSLLCSSRPPSCCHPQRIVTALMHSGTPHLATLQA